MILIPYKQNLAIATLLLLTISCNNNGADPYHFATTVDMSVSANPELPYCRKPVNVDLLDSLIVIGEFQDVSGVVKIYSKSTFRHLGSFGTIGKGPNEYIAPGMLKVSTNTKSIWFIDYPKIKFIGVKVNAILQKGEEESISPSIEFSFPVNLMPIFSYHVKSDSTVLLPCSTDSSLFSVIDMHGKLIEKLGPAHESQNKIPQLSKNYFYSRFMAFNEQREIAICAYYFHDRITQYCFRENTYKELIGRGYTEQAPQVLNDGNVVNNRVYFLSVKSNRDLVYALYLGGDYHNPDFTRNDPKNIFVFDWDLNPVANLKFSCPITDFAVDSSGRIYVLTSDNSNPLKVFQLTNEQLTKK